MVGSRRATSRFTRSTTPVGEWPSSAYARIALRIWPIVAAALVLCPATSPMTTATLSVPSSIRSYQSPPTSAPCVHGRYRAA